MEDRLVEQFGAFSLSRLPADKTTSIVRIDNPSASKQSTATSSEIGSEHTPATSVPSTSPSSPCNIGSTSTVPTADIALSPLDIDETAVPSNPPGVSEDETEESCCEVRETAGKGQGLFATRSIKAGTLVFKESPLINLSRQEEKSSKSIKAAFHALDRTQKKVYKALFDLQKGDVDPVVGIYYSNCYSTDAFAIEGSDDPLAHGGSCIGALASRINHSCVPNVCLFYVPPTDPDKPAEMHFYAFRPIAKGKEILSNYNKHMFNGTKKRQQIFLHQYGFTCSCEACVPPSAFWAKSDKRRGEMRKLIEELAGLEQEWEKHNASSPRPEIVRRPIAALVALESLLVKEKLIDRPLRNVYKSLAKWTVRAGEVPRTWLEKELAVTVLISGKGSRWSLTLDGELRRQA
ncbi:SET domain-containing protein 5 [Cyphellophora attinorum]|uniref:SET domain-containing protein 5 n=1 Tax=Cyphellophora attinorum TaxID=1664694 RepID=A0A0N1H534_9EURO|nr:SET domain-containing protein 5 [Phialophora attinorum]KPI36720.1 SET domain-containing protein 5 [Phialophora attinorum]